MSSITAAQLATPISTIQTGLNQLQALVIQANISPPGTQVTGPNSTAALSDFAGNQWTMAGAASGGQFIIFENGAVPPGAGLGTYITIDINGVIWSNAPSGWWKRISGGWTGMGSTGPVFA